MTQRYKLYINGEWIGSSNQVFQDVLNSANQEVIAQARKATEQAIKIGKDAFERGRLVFKDSTRKSGRVSTSCRKNGRIGS